MSEACFYRTHDREFGPVSTAELSRMIRQRLLVPGDSYRVGSESWRDVSSSSVLVSPSSGSGTLPEARGVQVIATSSQRVESAPWVYLSHSGVHGPFTTGQFLEAVQNGHIRPKTVIRLLQSPEWVAADQIDGLVFPPASATGLPSQQSSSIRSVVTPATPNAQMRHLFAECVSRQRASQPIHPARSSQSARDGDGTWWASSIGFVTSLVATLIESVVALGGRFVRSRLVWGLSGLLLVTFLLSRFSPHLTTQEQVHRKLQNTFEEYVRLRDRSEEGAEWTAFRTNASTDLAGLVPVLEQRADSDDRKSMSLLWLARDYLPAVLAAPPSGNPEAESKVQEHLAIIRQEPQGAAQRLTIEDWWTRVIVVLDVIAVMAAIVYFMRKRMAR